MRESYSDRLLAGAITYLMKGRLPGFRARVHPGHQRLKQGICSDYNEKCSNLLNSSFWSYKKDWNGQKAGVPQHYFDMPLGC